MVAFSPVRDVRNVLRRIRYIQARKFVPGWNDRETSQRLDIGFLHQVFRLFAILREPVGEIVELSKSGMASSSNVPAVGRRPTRTLG